MPSPVEAGVLFSIGPPRKLIEGRAYIHSGNWEIAFPKLRTASFRSFRLPWLINENKRTKIIRLSMEIAIGATEVQAPKLVEDVANNACLHETERLKFGHTVGLSNQHLCGDGALASSSSFIQ
jgi:hypothetical protein